MSYKIEAIEGIGPAYAEKLAAAGIKTTAEFLKHCAGHKGRKEIGGKTGISEKYLHKWANLADLMQIPGIGPQYSELLEAAGVDTVKELRNRNAANLAAKMKEVRERKRITRTSPAASIVERWVRQAKQIKPINARRSMSPPNLFEHFAGTYEDF